MQWLLASGGADADSCDADGDPAIGVAAAHGELEILQLLIDAGADVDARDSNGATPLVLACLYGHASCVGCLLEAGAKRDSKWQGVQPIQWASCSGHSDAVAVLSDAKAVLRAIPRGFGLGPDGGVALLDRSVNRLLAVPRDVVSRGTASSRKGVPVRAAVGEVAAAAAGGGATSEGWRGRPWVGRSLLAVLNASGQEGRGLAAQHPALLASTWLCGGS